MPSSRAACDSEPVASMCSSNAILPGPSALSGLKSIRSRIVGVCSLACRKCYCQIAAALAALSGEPVSLCPLDITNDQGAPMPGIRLRKLVGACLLVLACVLTCRRMPPMIEAGDPGVRRGFSHQRAGRDRHCLHTADEATREVLVCRQLGAGAPARSRARAPMCSSRPISNGWTTCRRAA